jgi:hypothetical protein
MTNGAKTPVASKGRPRANSAACDRAEALSSIAKQRPDAGSPSTHDVLASPPASDRAGAVADRLARLETLDLSAMRQEWRRLYRAEPPRLSRDLMMRALAYRIQEIAFGGAVEGDPAAVGGPLRRVRERWTDRNPGSTSDQTGSAPRPRMAWTNPRCRCHRRGFRVRGETLSIADRHRSGDHGRGLVRTAVLGLARAARASGRNHPPLGKSDWDGGRIDDPSQCVEA